MSEYPFAPTYYFTAYKGRVITTIKAESFGEIRSLRKHYLACGWSVHETANPDGKVIFRSKK